MTWFDVVPALPAPLDLGSAGSALFVALLLMACVPAALAARAALRHRGRGTLRSSERNAHGVLEPRIQLGFRPSRSMLPLILRWDPRLAGRRAQRGPSDASTMPAALRAVPAGRRSYSSSRVK